jgi:hypothetical protein
MQIIRFQQTCTGEMLTALGAEGNGYGKEGQMFTEKRSGPGQDAVSVTTNRKCYHFPSMSSQHTRPYKLNCHCTTGLMHETGKRQGME